MDRTRNVSAILAAIAARARGSTGLRGAHYPAPRSMPTTGVHLFVFADSGVVAHAKGRQRWGLEPKGYLVTPLVNASVPEQASVDDALNAVVDRYEADLNDELRHETDHCHVVRLEMSRQINLFGHDFFGHVLYWDVKAQRLTA